jgi:hypothetical protein
MAKPPSEPIFTVSLERGLADRHRLPMDQVISVLTEVRQLLIETGHQIQKERGIDERPLDFGLEILAEPDGRAFIAGSFRARIAITNNAEIGVQAAARVLDAVHDLNAAKKPAAKAVTFSDQPSVARIINRLDRMAFVQERSKAQAKFTVMVPRGMKQESAVKARTTATFGAVAVKRLASLREPVFTEEGVTLYGRLVELKDKSQVEREGGKFWGELRIDNGDRWRVQFESEAQHTAVNLFRKQVMVFGVAHYFHARTPKLVASEVKPDDDRDYLRAFDELLGVNKALYKANLGTMLARRYGDD